MGEDKSPATGWASDRALLLLGFVVPGLTYPFWHLVPPEDAWSPLPLWLAMGAAFLAVPVAHGLRPFSRTALQTAMSLLAALVTVHFFVLASVNDMSPFFAIGSSMSVLATAFFIRSNNLMIAYSMLVLVLGVGLYLQSPDPRKIAFWGGTAPVLFLAYHRLTAQLTVSSQLERELAERNREVSRTNQRLRSEIERSALLQEQLRVTQKMEAVGRLAGGVAHDFNNLLTTIGVYAELLLSGLAEDSPLRSQVRQIQKASGQAASLTHQLLTLGRRSHVPFQSIDLNEVVTDSAEMLRHLLQEDTFLELDLSPDPVPVWGNVDQLQQILINLCLNARDAIPASGRVTIGTRCCKRDRLERFDLDSKPTATDYVQLVIADSGLGMDREVRERAFDPFFTTKDPGSGAGLGLSIVHGIVSQAQGHIRVESEVGKGTRLELYWPMVPYEEHASEPARGLAYAAGGREILLVEDEADLRQALAEVLRGAGNRVVQAACAEDALEIYETRRRGFDLLVSDVVMPNMSGVELAERLLEDDPGLKVLLISGHLNERVMSRMPSDIPFLAKPFSVADLADRVDQLLGVEDEEPAAQSSMASR